MSHFSVLVIGENPEAQLQPYHEFECTGTNDQYVQDVDVTAEIRELMTRAEDPYDLEGALSYYGLEDKTVESESCVDKQDQHKYGYAIVVNGELLKAVYRTNPGNKWDWYQLGGRYTGRLKIKTDGSSGKVGRPGLMTSEAKPGYADQAYKRDIDYSAMQAEKETEGRERYRRFYSLIAGCEFPKSWAAIREQHGGNIDAARAAYNDQPAMKRCRSTQEFNWFGGDVAEEFCCTEDEYAQLCRARAVSTFAVVIDGKWYERGSMGWFACVADEKDERKWQEECAKLLAQASDDTLISIYDCHI